MKKTKYVIQSGFAFDEGKQMKMLQDLAKEGWILKSFALGGFAYKLEKEESQNICYSLDYFQGEEADLTEYYEIFRGAGWEPVCQTSDVHIFRAKEGTKPIYSEGEPLEEKYQDMRNLCLKLTLFFGVLSVLALGLFQIFDHTLVTIILGIGGWISLVFLIMSLMTLFAYTVRMKKTSAVNESKGHSNTPAPSSLTVVILKYFIRIVFWVAVGFTLSKLYLS